MSQLSVFWPDEAETRSVAVGESYTLRFPRAGRNSDQDPADMDIVTRARVMYANRTCHSCRFPVVEPIELSDGQYNRCGQTIPGTATLIGFRCCGCKNEWPV